MKYQDARRYLLNFSEAEEDYPFGPEVAVMKVRDRMFAGLMMHLGSPCMNLKCDPDEALALRDIFEEVTPAYHMNKRHWNTVRLDGKVPKGELQRMMDNSYRLVVAKLPKHRRPLLAR